MTDAPFSTEKSQRSTLAPGWLAAMAVVLVVASLAPALLLVASRL